MSVSRCKYVLAKILKASGILVVSFPSLAAADGGDDFSNNLFSDLAPILALFGEQVAKQFMSQSMGWADNILFAMAPLGIITAVVGAIRVAGPPILKVVVGRARENRAAAEVDLMSSTSHDVCELWNGQMIVRMMGSPPVLELIFLPGRENEADCGLLTSEELIGFHKGKSGNVNPPGGHDTEPATPRDEPLKSAPNIFLNLYPTGSRRTLRLLAGFAILLQLSVLIYSGFVSYSLKLEKGGRIAPYGYPLTATGMALLVIGMLICSHVVEQSTVEQTWEIEARSKGRKRARILWLQRGGYINDQSFSSFCILGYGARDSILTSRRRETFEEDSTPLIWLYFRMGRVFNRNWEGPNTLAGSEKYLRFLVVTGTFTSIFGFIIQFIGLRSMHWTASIAQLAATVIMILIRAMVRLRIANPPPTQRIPDGHELDWLATRIGGDPDPLWTSIEESKQNGYPRGAQGGILDEKCWNWSVVTGVGIDKFASLGASQYDSCPNDVVKIRKRLGELSNWTGPVSKSAISVARSVEAVMNTIFTEEEYPQLGTVAWSVYGRRGSKLGKIDLNVNRGEDKRWVACAAEVEAVLSLWLYSMKENNSNTIPNSTLSGGGPKGDWLRHGQAAVQHRTMKLLGGNEEYYRRDLHWYLGGWVNISQVQVDESPISEIKDSTSPISNIVEIETRNIVGFTNSGLEVGQVAPDRQKFMRFRTRAIPLYSDLNGTTPNSPDGASQTERYDHLAVISDSQIELLIAQDLFSSFMWGAVDKMKTLNVESTLRQAGRTQPTDLAWFDSLRLENPVLFSIAREIERAGLGGVKDAYASIIPPLSIKKKLPIPHCLVTHARKRARNHVAHGNWEGATAVFSKLFAICIEFGRSSPLAVEATAAVYDGLRAARAGRYLWERWQPNPKEIEALKKQELDLQQVLGAADKRVVLTLETMHKVQRPGADGGGNPSNNRFLKPPGMVPGKPPYYDITGFSSHDKDCLHLTLLHCAVIAGNQSEVSRCLKGANVDVMDVFGWTPLHYAATQGSLKITWLLLSTTGSTGADPNIKDFSGRTALHQAGGNGHSKVVELLLENGAYIGEKDNHGSTPLHLAANSAHRDSAVKLLENGADKEARDIFGCRPLHCAANSGSLDIVRLLLEGGVDKEPEDKIKQTPLHQASYNGHPEVVRFLLESGSDKERTNDRGDTPLHHAAYTGHLEVTKLLLQRGADKEAANGQGEKPLHYTAYTGHREVLQLLLKEGADKEATNLQDDKPLHYAAYQGHLEVMQLLLEKGADKEANNARGYKPLHYAAYKGHLEVTQLLLEKGAKKEAKNNLQDRPLHMAIYSGRPKVVQVLLEYGADKEAKNNLQDRPLHMAIYSGRPEVVQVLLEYGADKEAEGRDKNKPLHIAANEGRLEVVQLLLEKGADKEVECGGRRLLHDAAYSGHLDLVRMLLENGADKEAEDNQGCRPLHGAASSGHLEVVRLLLENGADKETKNKQGDRPLHRAAYLGRLEIVQLLLENAVDKEAKNNRGDRPLHSTAYQGHLGVTRLLLENGADKEAEDNEGDRPLHRAAYKGRRGVVQLLLNNGADKEAKNNQGDRPLHMAAYRGRLEVVQLLLENGADKEAEGNHGGRPLHYAAGAGHLEVIRILENGADMEARADSGGRPLHRAAYRGRLKVAQLLLEKGADREAEDNQGTRPLQLAARIGHLEVVRLLLEHGADKEAKNMQENRPLHTAACQGHLQVVQLLLENGADKEAEGNHGSRPLQLAAGTGHLKVVRLLLENGADQEAEGSLGARPLQLAAATGHLEVVRLFLEKGADREAKGILGARPLQLATATGDLGVLRLLLAAGADMEAEDNQGGRPLHFAARIGRLDVVRLLLEKGADKEAEDNQGARPLHDAASIGHLEVVRLLLGSGADKEAKNKQGDRPLHLAAYFGSLEVVRLLLDNGADKEAEDNQGGRPLHDAASSGNLEVVRLLLDNGADKEAEGNHGGRPLHYAARRGHLDVVQLLLEKGADKEAEENQGDRPLHVAAGGWHLEVVRLLLENGADQEAKNKRGQKPKVDLTAPSA